MNYLIFCQQIFTQLKMTHPNFASRVILVSGEMTSPGMGLSEEDLVTLRENVSCGHPLGGIG
jgi:fatty acyl-CoA reductase